MNSKHATNCEAIRRNFENQEAIYIEGGALRVRVMNIQASVKYLTAQVEEIPTPGLVYISHEWEIGAGSLTTFSDHTWAMGYGMWTLFFATRVVQGVVDLASRWPENLDYGSRYNEVLRWLEDHDAYERTRRVFPES